MQLDSLNLNLSTWRRSVVHAPAALPRVMNPCYPLNRRLGGGAHSWSASLGDLPTCSRLTILTELSRISYNHHRLTKIVSAILDNLWCRLDSDQSIITPFTEHTGWSNVMHFTCTTTERKAHQLPGFSHSVVTPVSSDIACHKRHATLFLTDPKHSNNFLISLDVKQDL
jgi:hypothetical protein